ncbi:MAG: hypothetical protein ABR536_03080 [Solirubrobacterales bacterium]
MGAVAVAVVLVLALSGGDDENATISNEPTTTSSSAVAAELAKLAQEAPSAPAAPQPAKPNPQAPKPAPAPKTAPAPKPAGGAAKALDCKPVLGNGSPFPVRSTSATQPEPCESARSVALHALSSGSSQVGEWSCERGPSPAIELKCTAGDRTIVVEGSD